MWRWFANGGWRGAGNTKASEMAARTEPCVLVSSVRPFIFATQTTWTTDATATPNSNIDIATDCNTLDTYSNGNPVLEIPFRRHPRVSGIAILQTIGSPKKGDIIPIRVQVFNLPQHLGAFNNRDRN